MRKIHFIVILYVSLLSAISLSSCKENSTVSSVHLSTSAAQFVSSQNSDGYMEVDCLLPGQVRKLGNMIYAAPRRPLKTTANDCEIRGGEYVIYDRANYKSALAVWMVEAESGDPVAQTYVGEIYMKSPLESPRYDLAAKWFERAAKNGHKRAQINIGYLYEHGLGVGVDMDRAVSWYSKASGVNVEDIVQRHQLTNEERAELAELKEQNASQLEELKKVRKTMAIAEDKFVNNQHDLEKRSAQIALYQQEITAHQAEIEAVGKRLEADNIQSASILKSKLAGLQQSMKEKEDELASQKQLVFSLSSEIKAHKVESRDFETTLGKLNRKIADLPGPKIEILNPDLLRTRGIVFAPVSKNIKDRVVTGRVWSPAGLKEFKVNGKNTAVKEDGTFRVVFSMGDGEVSVNAIVIDENNREDKAQFTLKYRSGSADSSTAAITRDNSSITFGNYYALVIGNNEYEGLPRLRTAVADAREVGKLLKERYGFQVTVLYNANRHAMLSTLNDFRKRLTEKDNFLIYYAGHGTLEERNTQGFWLPVDSSLDDDVNWLPTDRVTGIMNLMSAKQIMIIADACYSGIMTRASTTRLESGKSTEAYTKWLRKIAGYKSRVVISSGETKPVLDGGGGEHSVFAKALLESLRSNTKVLLGIDLHRAIAEKVVDVSGRIGHDQVPQYAGLNRAGHELGDFLFVPVPKG